MATMTQTMKAWLVENQGLPADAGEFDSQKAMGAAIADGKLTGEKYGELMTDPDAGKAVGLDAKLDAILSRLDAVEKAKQAAPIATPEPTTEEKATAPSKLERLFAKAAGDGASVRVKTVKEKFDGTRKSLTFPERTKSGRQHPFAGQAINDPVRGGNLDSPSQLDLAVCGAYFKFVVNCERGFMNVPAPFRMTDTDQELIKYAVHEMPWCGEINAGTKNPLLVENEMLSPVWQKALLDDGTSGGIDLAPTVFDDQIIRVPYLNGEFFPRVTVVNIPRGRRIEGASIGQLSLNSGGADATAITLFTTANFVTAFDTTIFVVDGAIEIGLDFISDSPVPIGQIITDEYGQALLTWLDTQIQVGDGTTEPQGVMVASGTTLVTASSIAMTVGGYLSMFFGIPKQFKTGAPTTQIAFGATETTYMRARAIATGSAYNTLAFGMENLANYELFAHPFAISGSMTNAQVSFVNYKRYRMYRRLGATFKTTTEGRTLVRANEMMVSLRARFGGQLEDGNAAAVVTDALA